MHKLKAIAIIPARSGSKRIKNKNVKLFFGYPIIYYSIKAALKSKCFEKIFVSTDSKKIANISKKYGAEVPFIRSKKLSGDNVTTVSVIKDLIKKLRKKIDFEYVCCIYPAAPFIKIKNLKKAYSIVKKNKELVFPISPYESSIDRAITFKNKKLILKNPYLFKKKSQDLSLNYYDSGQFYFGTVKNFLTKTVIKKKSIPIILKKFESVDINDKLDFSHSEKIFKLMNK
jgi:pseudaminic acid cytidylyltransferase